MYMYFWKLVVIAHLDKAASCPMGTLLHGLAVHFEQHVFDPQPPVLLSNAPFFEEVHGLDLKLGHRLSWTFVKDTISWIFRQLP